MRSRTLAAFGLSALAFALALRAIEALADARVNRVLAPPSPAEAPPGLPYADLHASPTVWGRDLLAPSRRGHADLPRLRRGGVGLQVFSVVSQTPLGVNLRENKTGALDLLTVMGIAQWRSPRTWFDRKARALDGARRLGDAAERSAGGLVLVRRSSELGAALSRPPESRPVAAVLSLEGGAALEGNPANVRVLHDAGFRILSLSHFVDNEFGGSAHGEGRGGLTPTGKAVLAEMSRAGMILDLAHASERLFDDALASWRGPVVVSHAGPRALCDNPCNLTDSQLRAIAGRDGLVGVGFWPAATCGEDAAAAARALRHAVRIAGPDAVSLGSDFDGGVAQPFDARGLPALAAELARAGLSSSQIDRVMGGNLRRFLLRHLPP
ncbi:MAG: membrane dipeptidase [Elusimicrobia bacterium]|nr:membrane dipeptidase [Elusimicrobiota bacterium]